MKDKVEFPVTQESVAITHCTKEQYMDLYQESIQSSEKFWASQIDKIDWIKAPTRIKNTSFGDGIDPEKTWIKWFEDGQLNFSYNCIDRHLKDKGEQVALIWEGNEVSESKHISYNELHTETCKFANTLKAHNIKKGDRVILYLSMIPEAIFAMLACTRIGAVHSIVFGGFSPNALANRITDCGAKCIITVDEGYRGLQKTSMKENINKALEIIGEPSTCDHVIMITRTGAPVKMVPDRDVLYSEAVKHVDADCPIEPMNAEDPLFILYTSGSTGQPKGILHTTAGYLLYASMTFKYIFDYQENETFWCTADIGWITGHSYTIYGPLANGAKTLIFEGVPHYPDPSRFWQVIDKHQVNIFYTAPTAIRMLMRDGDGHLESTSRKSLRVLGSVGEPINPEAWMWFYNVVGKKRCQIVDTWWQTETGGILISPLPGATRLKPGAATNPFFGINPQIFDADDNPATQGHLCILDSWPGQARTIYNDHKKFVDTYFQLHPGKYFTGDNAQIDEDGDYWITGRVDDILNIAGHRIGTAEIESALVSHPKISEAAVVSYSHDIKGQGIYVYATPLTGVTCDDTLRAEVITHVRAEIGPIATPDTLQWAHNLPKTRSGKIMRRILRKIANNDFENLGDVSTLSNPTSIEELIEGHKALSA